MVNVTFLVRDRFNLTRQTLESFADAGTIEKKIVTILDDRSRKPTREFVECWCSDHNANYIRNEFPMGTGPLRNVVIKSSVPRGQYLYVSDNDLFFNPQWLDRLILSYEDAWGYGFRVIGAYNHPFHVPEYVLGIGVKKVNALATQSMLMRWEVWDKYGPFCQTPVDKVCQSEDVDFTNKIVADGFKLGVVSPALVVSTGITNTFGEKIPGWELVKAQAPEGVIVE